MRPMFQKRTSLFTAGVESEASYLANYSQRPPRLCPKLMRKEVEI